MQLTLAQFTARCPPNSTDLYPAINRIGKFGNPNRHNPSDWLTLPTPREPTKTYRTSPSTEITNAPVWDAATYTCHGILASTRLTVNTAFQGAYGVPQASQPLYPPSHPP